MKKVWITAILVLFVSIQFTACNKADDSGNSKSTEVKKTDTKDSESESDSGDKLVFSTGLWSVPSQRQYISKNVVDVFVKETGIPVDFQYIDGNIALKRAKLQKKLGRVNMDIVTIHSGKMPIWIDNGFVHDLSPILDKWGDVHFFSLFDNSAKRDGDYYFFPIVSDVYIMIANRKALKYLPKNADINNLTWEQFVQWSHNIRKGEGVGRTAISAVPTNSFIYQFGAIELSYGAKFPDLYTPGALKAWQILLDLKPDYVPNVLNVAKPSDALQRGYAWLTFIHVADAGEVYNSDPTKFIIAALPEGSKGRGSIGAGYGLGLLKGAKHKEEAVKLMKYLLSPEVQVKIAKGSGGFIPPVKEAMKCLGDSPQDKVIRVGLEVFQKAILSGVPSQNYYDWNAVKMIFDNLFKEMIMGEGKIDMNMLKDAEKQLDDVTRK